MITVVVAPPFATVQDLGREGYRASGVPVSGAMDRDTAVRVNTLLHNAPGAAMIEWAIAGGVLRFDAETTIAMGGADVSAFVRDTPLAPYQPLRMRAGDELRVERFVRGRFLYVAIAGGIDVPVVMGSRSTTSAAGIGGYAGRRLRKGDILLTAADRAPHYGVASTPSAVDACDARDAPVPIMCGPRAHLFDDAAWAQLLSAEYFISRASDRRGYRLDGPSFTHVGDAAIPSEPTCVGAIQIPDGGTPIVLMNDGPTVGGYPIIAVIRSNAMSRFAQLTPGDRVMFMLKDSAE